MYNVIYVNMQNNATYLWICTYVRKLKNYRKGNLKKQLPLFHE